MYVNFSVSFQFIRLKCSAGEIKRGRNRNTKIQLIENKSENLLIAYKKFSEGSKTVAEIGSAGRVVQHSYVVGSV